MTAERNTSVPTPPDPTPADVVEQRRRRLIRQRLAEQGLSQERSSRIVARPAGGPAPLSSAQHRMWFFQRLEPTTAAYNLSVAADLYGPLDSAALAEAFRQVAVRHEILRTVYPVGADGSAAAVVVDDPRPVLQVVDLTVPGDPAEGLGQDGPLDQARAQHLAVDLGAEPFDLAAETPLRVRLLHLGPDHHVLVLVMHHIACDDLSWAVLFGEVTDHYRASTLPSPPIQYRDYACWEQDDRHLGAELDYWAARLDPLPPPAAPMPDFPRTAVPGSSGSRCSHTLPASVSDALTRLARAEGVTFFMTLLAGYTALLHRYTGLTDIAVGSPLIDREAPELRTLIGNFGNTVVLRTDAGGDPSFRELLRRVRETCIEAYSHQSVPFERVVERVRPPRSPGRGTLFETMLSARGATTSALDLPGVTARDRSVDNGTARFDLAIEGVESPAGVVLTATFRTVLYRAESAARLLGHLAELLAGAAEDPTLPVSRLPLLTAVERETILHGWNATARPEFDVHRNLADLVHRQVRRTPDGTAVVCGDQRLTYAELDAAAQRLADRLRRLGAGPETLVGVHLERSIELIVGLLGILKAGAAFVPLEPSWPPQRVADVVADAMPLAILSHTRHEPAFAGTTVLHPCDPAADPAESGGASNSGGGSAGPHNLAYVIYTSGTTGRPKGAMIVHRAICNRLPWQEELLRFGRDDAVLHKAPLGFDISVNEIFLPLAVGARLVVASPGIDKDPDQLIDLIARERVSFVYLTSSMLEAMLNRDTLAGVVDHLRHVWCGGEVLSPELFARFRHRFPEATMYHGYGPAEATIGVSCEVYRGEIDRYANTIGRANPNTVLRILDRYLNPVPVGVPGELHIGGIPLARGYLGDPGRTARAFIVDPFGEPGERLYASGDLARYRADGVIEFLGRADQQVKIRGHRIELEEIETVLARHPAARHAAVVVRTDRTGAPVLAGYCSSAVHHGLPPDGTEIRAWLRTQLPEYMVPGSVQFLADLPLLPSGKIDRAALAALPAQPRSASTSAPPDGGMAAVVARIWADLLEVSTVGIHDNFFDLGGHSLLLLRAQSILEKELGRPVRAVDLFTYSTVADLARHLDDSGSTGGAPEPTGDDPLAARERRRRQALARRAAPRTGGRSDG